MLSLSMYPKGNLFIPSRHGQLEAILKEPSEPRKGVALVCHPHPLGGGTMHNKVVFRIAAGLVDAGLTTLRFNFSGVGASTGVHNDVEGGVEDVTDALAYLKAEFPEDTIVLAGFSFGSRTGMQVGMADDHVKCLISVGTPVEKYNDFDFLTQVKKPILFLHGDTDEFCTVGGLRSITDKIPQAEVVIFEHGGHFFDDHLKELRETVRAWTEKQLLRN
ncbi:MAG: alpha/beta fold hydrolase [Pyrinomonadaceae bacterium]|nr:alpha/beta fold hydrolase [Pyrinomonadaceae bacterium]